MGTIAQGLKQLGFRVHTDFVCRDDIQGKGVYLAEWHSSKPQPTDEELAHAVKAWDAQEYARQREAEYPSIKELIVALYDTEDKAAIDAKRAEIKKKYPKGAS